MQSISANLNIMIKAAEKASRALIRDFGEIEKLQVSIKGPTDFVSNADIKAETICVLWEITHEKAMPSNAAQEGTIARAIQLIYNVEFKTVLNKMCRFVY